MAEKKTGNDSADFTKFGAEALKKFQNFKMPGVDSKQMANSHRKNMETLATAQKSIMEAGRALAQAQTQFARQTMEDGAGYMRNMMSAGGDMQAKMDAHTKSVNEAMKNTLAHGQEITGALNKSSEKFTKIVQGRLHECAEEAHKMGKTATKK